MRNIRLKLEYDGSRYYGWQRLGKGEEDNTIENKIISIIEKMTGEKVELYCGSRTETGVHAYGQVANFKTKSDMKLYEIKNYFNRYLPMDIAVMEITEMEERFHASLNPKSRTYLYRIAICDAPSVFDRKYTYYSFKAPDIKLMKRAAKLIEGKHDFKNFSTVKRSKSTTKEIYQVDIHQTDKEIQISIKANDFLHNMARMIASTLLEIATGKCEIEDINTMLEPTSGKVANLTVEAKGLFLKEIEY